jgi:hypothetical protein
VPLPPPRPLPPLPPLLPPPLSSCWTGGWLDELPLPEDEPGELDEENVFGLLLVGAAAVGAADGVEPDPDELELEAGATEAGELEPEYAGVDAAAVGAGATDVGCGLALAASRRWRAGMWRRTGVRTCDAAWCSCAASARAGARPRATDSGSDKSPTGGLASWLADHAIAAVATIPSSAAVPHITVRWVMADRR